MATITPTADDDEFRLDRPAPEDGAALWQLVRDVGVLDQNSAYVYVIIGEAFAATSVVARRDGRLFGFVSGFRPPERPDVLFVWQVGVDSGARGHGLAGRMLDDLVQRTVPVGVRWVETTVTPSNAASRAMFASLARRHSATITESGGFAAELFPGAGHEPERLLRIGPFATPRPIQGAPC